MFLNGGVGGVGGVGEAMVRNTLLFHEYETLNEIETHSVLQLTPPPPTLQKCNLLRFYTISSLCFIEEIVWYGTRKNK